ncbi:MAG: hypothetical protein ABIJ61_08030 [bacterium]
MRVRFLLLLTTTLSLLSSISPLCRIAKAASGPTISRILVPNDSGYFVGELDEEWLLLCGADTLTPGQDYEVRDGSLHLVDSTTCCDTLRLLRHLPLSTTPQRYFLHELVTERSPVTRDLPVESQPIKENTPSSFQVSGTKTFSADLSDRRQAGLSQGLALTLSGDIGHGIIVRGSFSDQGLRDDRLVTRRFSELDNVYLEVESEHLSGRFGSYKLVQNRFNYLQLNRQVQGLSLQYQDAGYQVATTLSLPPGNFVSNSLVVREGDYGPYLLTGANGDLGVAVVEHSERVWLNGRLLERGRDQDYYVDYLQGELFFTGRRNPNEGDRLRIDFEYQQREYRKTLMTGAVEREMADGDAQLGVGLLSLTAAPDDPLDFSLSATDRAALAAAGDNPAAAEVPGAQFVGNGAGDYLREIDSLYGELFTYVGDSLGDYRVSFSKVESGDYIYLGGGQYQFVGSGLGQYLPIKSLPLPEAAQLVSLRGELQLASGLRLRQETALSLYDRNRLSALDDGDNDKVAAQLHLDFGKASQALSGTLSAELLPGGFFRTSRLEAVEEDYLWQRRVETQGDRQRYLVAADSRLTPRDKSHWEAGYTKEVDGFTSARGSNETSIELPSTRLHWNLNLADAEDTLGTSSLVEIQPEVTSTWLPVRTTLSGLYDLRHQRDASGTEYSQSRRELGGSLSYAGISFGARQRENWSSDSLWRMESRKRSLSMEIARALGQRGRLTFVGHANWLDQSAAPRESYQTGSLDLDWPRLAELLSINTRLRLSRRGRSESRETYLKVDEGDGDYILEDSIYVADPRGDYIRVTEQVGAVSQKVEAEKQVKLELALERFGLGVLTRGSSLRYEINSQEIGAVDTRFQTGWLLPPESYFTEPTFSRRRQSYRLRRYERTLGLTVDLEYQRHHNLNLLDIARPSEENGEQGSLLLSQRVGARNVAELQLAAQRSEDWENNRRLLKIESMKAGLSYRIFFSNWEAETGLEIGHESEDSLHLSLLTYRVSQEIAYKVQGLGRVDATAFLYQVQSDTLRNLPRQLADGFPIGTNLGARLRADFQIAGNFSLKISATGELRDGEDNRYYLRSELTSRFE